MRRLFHNWWQRCDKHIAGLHLWQEDYVQRIARRAFIAGYKAAQKEKP